MPKTLPHQQAGMGFVPVNSVVLPPSSKTVAGDIIITIRYYTCVGIFPAASALEDNIYYRNVLLQKMEVQHQIVPGKHVFYSSL